MPTLGRLLLFVRKAYSIGYWLIYTSSVLTIFVNIFSLPFFKTYDAFLLWKWADISDNASLFSANDNHPLHLSWILKLSWDTSKAYRLIQHNQWPPTSGTHQLVIKRIDSNGKQHLVSAGNLKLARNRRLKVERTRLHITKATRKDAGTYSCTFPAAEGESWW